MGERAWLAPHAGILARALVDLGRYGEAEEWSRRAEEMSAGDDVDAQKHWRQARARVLAQKRPIESERLARETVALAEQTDMTSDHGDALMDLAEVVELAGKRDEASAAFEQALVLYERKGNIVMADRAGSKLARLSPKISP